MDTKWRGPTSSRGRRANAHERLRALRRRGSRLLFGWGGALSALSFALLSLFGRSPDLDHHLTVTAWSMLFCWLALRAWLFEHRRRLAAARG